MCQRFIDANERAIASVKALQTAINDLEGKTVVIRVEYQTIGSIPDIHAVQQVIKQVYVPASGPDVPRSETQNIIQRVVPAQGTVLPNLIAQSQEGNVAASLAATMASFAAMTKNELMQIAKDLNIPGRSTMNKPALLGAVTNTTAVSGVNEAANVNALTTAIQNQSKAADADVTSLLAAAAAVRAAGGAANAAGGGFRGFWGALGGGAGAAGLAAFGITGIATAIHLVVMGVAEFLAVFIPAMYAAAAGAYVMMQGMQNVAQNVKAIYTATEALGPMMGKTAGDMLGLGHSIQTAQDMANPGVYELYGEAIGAIDAFSGQATLGLNGLKVSAQGAKGGLSGFAQVGLDVTHMLDAFGAKVVADLQGPMGATLHALVEGAVNDLRGFGQILGNIGAALANFASKMPGIAPILLGIVDAFTQVIKWVSQLPAPLIGVILGFEEAWRWSGVLAGAFGLLGKAIALLGTLGLPVLREIGLRFGTMAAGILTGIGGMIGNLGGLGSGSRRVPTR